MSRYQTRVPRRARGLPSLGAALLFVLVTSTSAVAQGMGFTFVGVGETAGDNVNLLLGQVSAHRGGLGLMPVFSLQSYVVTIEGDTDATWAITPAAGLRYRASTGSLQAKVGYSIRPGQGEDDPNFPFFGGSDAGVTTSVQGDYWNGGAYGLQGIGSYNWGSEYLWSRARGTLRLMELAGGALHGGAEAVWQGDIGDEERTLLGETRPNYGATQAGPLLQWNSSYVIGVLGAGWKMIDSDFADFFGDDDSTWYLKAELVFTPR